MSYTVIKTLPPAEEIIQAFPLSASAQASIAQDRQEIKAILDGLSITDPCLSFEKTEAFLLQLAGMTSL